MLKTGSAVIRVASVELCIEIELIWKVAEIDENQ